MKERMTGPEFVQWVGKMKEAGRAKSQADCARKLGRTDDWARRAVHGGADRTTALACAALLAGREPYGEGW